MTFKDLKYVIMIASVIALLVSLGIVGIMFLLMMIDIPTQKHIGTEQVKCIDDVGAEFIDEWCDKEIYCSWLGIDSSVRCKNVKESLK